MRQIIYDFAIIWRVMKTVTIGGQAAWNHPALRYHLKECID